MAIPRRISTMLGAGTAIVLSAGTPVRAQDADGDIIVTARRVEERLQDVPISISVLSQSEIDDRNIVSAKDIAIATPSLGVNTRYGAESTSFALRGFAQEAFTAPSVAVYFADVVAPRGASSIATGEGAGPGAFFDLQNVQILKGPQGTLFGRNTTGGAVLLVPQKPKSEFGGYVEGSIGNHDLRRVQAVLNVPLSPIARFRLGIDRMKREGYLDNITDVGPRHLADTDYLALRGSLLVELTPRLETYTIVSYAKSDTNNAIAQLSACNRNVLLGRTMPTGYFSCDQIERERATGNPYAVSNSTIDPRSKLRQWQIINTTTFEASDSLTIKNIVSYAELKNFLRFDVFGVGWLLPSAAELAAAVARGDAPAGSRPPAANSVGRILGTSQPNNYPLVPANHQSTFTEELQFQGKALDGRLTWQAGGYLELSNPLTNFTGFSAPGFLLCTDVVALQCTSPYGAIGSLSRELANRRYRDVAAYAQASYDITEKIRVTGGIRYTDDLSRSEDRSYIFRFSTTGTLIQQACTNSGAVLPDCYVRNRERSKAPTWLIDLDYRPMSDVLVYAKYARGYRQGQTNPRALDPYKSYGPEQVDAYEVGAKAGWRGAVPGSFSIAGFYNDLNDAQVQVSWRQGSNATTAIVNGGRARIYGVEADGTISPFTGFSLSGSAAYLNARFRSVTVPSAPPPFTDADTQTSVLSSIPLIFAPKFKYTATVAYVLPLDESAGKVRLGVTWTHTSGYYTLANVGGNVPGYGLLNFNLNWEHVAGKPIDLALFATNVTDRKYATFRSAYLPNLGFQSDVLGEPRMYGLRLRYDFGADAR